MRIFFISLLVLLAGCQTSYITPEGGRLLQNSVVGCALGEVLFGKCAEGAAVGAGATIISDQ